MIINKCKDICGRDYYILNDGHLEISVSFNKTMLIILTGFSNSGYDCHLGFWSFSKDGNIIWERSCDAEISLHDIIRKRYGYVSHTANVFIPENFKTAIQKILKLQTYF